MKKIVFLLGLSVICFKLAVAQKKDITGTYYNESGHCLQLRADSIKLLVRQTTPVTRPSDLRFEGKYKWVDKTFIELNSMNNPWEKVRKTIEIIQEKRPDKKDIEVKFFIPYNWSDLKITMFTNDFYSKDFIYSKNEQSTIIPKTKTFSFNIVPEYLIPHTPIGTFYGIIAFDLMIDYEIESGMNYIEIKIPAMTDSFFETYYIEGDYAQVINDSIIWKGVVYKKAR